MSVPELERLKLWVRSGGRCALCKEYLLGGPLTEAEVFVGEGAHIVGERDSLKSPRGKDPLPESERNKAENLLLACPTCHTEIDKKPVTTLMTPERLLKFKHDHEAEVFHQTGLSSTARTTVLRVVAPIRGAAMSLTSQQAAEAVLRSADMFPHFLPGYDQQGVEIDLATVPGEADADSAYYRMAGAVIDDRLRRVREGVEKKEIQHLSVFAAARVPVLVYLGHALDDGVPLTIYQRHRATQSWQWPEDGPDGDFDVRLVRPGEPDSHEAVLLTNLSGTTGLDELPAELTPWPVYAVSPTAEAGEDVFTSAATVISFVTRLRAFFTELEARPVKLSRLHVMGALPIAGAVALGHLLKSKDLRPEIVLHDRTSTGYREVMSL